jgi:hypothetical protein
MDDETKFEELPTDEPVGPAGKWTMPEPIFRSSEGENMSSEEIDFSVDDIATEIANVEDDQLKTTPQNADQPVSKNVEPTSKKGKSGCGQTVLFLVGMVGAFLAMIIAAFIYYFYFFRSTDSGTF